MYEPPPSVASSRSLARPVRASLVVPMLVAAGLVGCGGAPALLQPAHPLAKGVIEYGAGVTTQVSLGSGQDEIAKAEADPAPSRDARTTRTWLRGAYQKAVVAPGIAPWIGGRAGLGDGNEASLVYTGRNLRLGARHAWLWESTALSVGGGLASILTRRASDSTAGDQEGFPPGRVDWSAHGVGLDLPVTFGWSSQSELIQAWVGARAGFEALFGDLPFTAESNSTSAEASATHWQGGGVAGFSVGISPVWVRAELNAAWHHVSAQAELPAGAMLSNTERDSFGAFTLAPAGAVFVQF